MNKDDFQDIPGLRFAVQGQTEAHAGLPVLRVENAWCRASIALQGAQILSFQAGGEPPLLWLSEAAVCNPGKAVRGGIPLCFPWFGPHPQDKSLPAHGFARSQAWRLCHAQADAAGHVLTLQLVANAQTRALWPYEFTAELTVQLGQRLQLKLSVSNTDTRPFSFTQAFHSYFPVQDIARTQVEGLDNCHYIDQLEAAQELQRQAGPVRFTTETDRIYLAAGGLYHIVEDGSERRITIKAEGCQSAVVWNPWQEKAARLGDMGPEGWQHMLCVECGNIGSDVVLLAAGNTRSFSLLLDASDSS